MNEAIGRLRQWWEGRTLRERRMLAAMAILAAAVAVWLGAVRPALAWREAAAEARATAEADHVAVLAALARTASAKAGPDAPADARGLEPIIRQAAEASGLEITTGMDESGRLGFRIAQGSTAAVFGWLAALKTTHGLDVTRLGVVENADATLQVEGAF
jgi:general secretion pathway protein M